MSKAGERPGTRDGRRKIDWTAAKAAFVGDPTRSYGKIGRRFGVSEGAVGKHAKREGWEEVARQFDRDTEERALKAQGKTRDEHIARATLTRDLAFQAALDGLLEKTLEVRLSDLPALGKYVELLTGEATDRPEVTIGEVREFVSVLFVRVATLIEPARRPDYLALIRELEGQLPAGEPEADGA